MQRVLVLSCSRRKQPDVGLLAAIERYDGPSFRVLRRYLQRQPVDPPDVYILSAEFGLISAEQPIPDYDRRMTPRRADDLKPAVAEALSHIFDVNDGGLPAPSRLLVCLGKDYRRALGGYRGSAAGVLSERFVSGGLGSKLTQLRDWLYEEPSYRPVNQLAGPYQLEVVSTFRVDGR